MRPDGPRDTLAGPDAGPESPYPIKVRGPVIKGFGRGSKEVSPSEDPLRDPALSRLSLLIVDSLVIVLLFPRY